jgi:predicted NBD/HSP70 family sugar kinase
MAELGYDATDSRDVVQLVRNGNPDAIEAVREAGRQIGTVLATTVNLLNPRTIMIGGDVAQAHDYLLAGIREIVYTRATTLATTELVITSGTLGDEAGVRGGAAMILDHILAPANVDAVLERDEGGRGAIHLPGAS